MKSWKFSIGIILLLILFIVISFISYLLLAKLVEVPSSILLYYFITSIVIAFGFSICLIFYLKVFLLKNLKNTQPSFTPTLSESINTSEVKSQKIPNDVMTVLNKNNAPPSTKNSEAVKFLSVTEQQRKDDNVKIVHYDELTTLPNRVYFNEILNKTISHSKRHNKQLAIILIDIDHFERVNQNHSKEFGDIVLRHLSHAFSKILRADDILARSGGDEFIILLNDIEDPKFASPVAEKILQTCRNGITVKATKINLQASIGITVFPSDGQSLEELENKADAALFKAKRLGGNLYQYFKQEMDLAVHEQVKMENSLRKAIDNNELVLYFQPQLSLENGTIKTVEALIRWEHPQLGLLSPDKFIPLAEATGLIIPIGEWALREACKINKAWQNAGYEPIVVSVNISPTQFQQQDLRKIIADLLDECELSAKYFEIEITETAVMDNLELAVSKLSELRSMGVSIALDDFGTGYTSISYLRQFPVNVLKIDQTFIKGIPHNQNDLAITSAVISLGHNLGLDVVAEGVETIEQIQYLAENNCDLIQGYFLSRPLPATKIVLQFSKK